MSSLSACAVSDSLSRGRRHVEPAQPALRGMDLDRHRVVHCTAFRRLEYKTQVFVTHEGDHYRTRLTHTLEVAAQARRLATALRLNATLAEVIALAHDLGHPPFGHAGEAALAECMAGHGGFEHNRQSLRVVDYLEHPYPDFRGLNLLFEVREGLIKHRTRYDRPRDHDGDAIIRELLAAGPMPTLEAQAANLADEIAYTVHDVEDGLLLGQLDEQALGAARLWKLAAEPWRKRHPKAHVAALRRAVLDSLLDLLIDNAAATSRLLLETIGVRNLDAVRRHESALVDFSDGTRADLDELQQLLRTSVYQHASVRGMDEEGGRIIRGLFNAYVADPSQLPERFARRVAEQGLQRVVCDYVAGMTDRFCRAEFERLK